MSKAGRKRLKPSFRNRLTMNTEDNGNGGYMKPTSSSNEDLSEYTDADESISAPTEFLAEFLSAVMLKDYETALKYCKLILQYEPNNATAQEFYPLILEKLRIMEEEQSSEEDEEENSNTSGTSDSDTSNSDTSEDQEEEEEDEAGQGVNKNSNGSSDGEATTGSYSSLEDDEAETDNLAALTAKCNVDNVSFENGNKFFSTTAIKPSLCNNLGKCGNKNQIPFGTSSDSESPTEPISQQTVAFLRAKVVPTKQ